MTKSGVELTQDLALSGRAAAIALMADTWKWSFAAALTLNAGGLAASVAHGAGSLMEALPATLFGLGIVSCFWAAKQTGKMADQSARDELETLRKTVTPGAFAGAPETVDANRNWLATFAVYGFRASVILFLAGAALALWRPTAAIEGGVNDQLNCFRGACAGTGFEQSATLPRRKQ